MKKIILSIQHLLAMFGATVLVPLLTGFDPSVAIFCAGVGTLLFHKCTDFKVPVFLGSSFAFISVINQVKNTFNLTFFNYTLLIDFTLLFLIIWFPIEALLNSGISVADTHIELLSPIIKILSSSEINAPSATNPVEFVGL